MMKNIEQQEINSSEQNEKNMLNCQVQQVQAARSQQIYL